MITQPAPMCGSSPDGPAEVDASLRSLPIARPISLPHLSRLTPPILSVRDRHVSVSVTVPRPAQGHPG